MATPSPASTANDAAAKKANEIIAAAKAKEAEAKRVANIKKQIKELEKKIAIGKASVKKNTDAKAQAKAALTNYLNSIGNPTTYTVSQANIIAGYSKNIAERTAEAKRQQDQLDAIENQIKSLRKSLTPAPFVPKYIPGPKDETPPPALPPTNYAGVAYQYNIPMLQNAYLNPFGPQGNSVGDRKLLAAPEYSNGRRAWNGVTPSRGTIQMSKMFAENALTADEKANA